jgi:FdhD protein
MSTVKVKKPGTTEVSRPFQCLKLKNGLFSRAKVDAVIEEELPVHINGRHLVTASITPGMEAEFVTGYLFTQGFINSLAELESVKMENNTMLTVLKDSHKALSIIERDVYHIASGGGKTVLSRETDYTRVRTDLKIRKNSVLTAMNRLFEEMELYKITEGAHGAGLFTAEAKPVCIVEDIGRHNCLDKLIGYTLMNGIDCSRTFLVSTGRMTSEMVAKICRAGIAVAATKTAVTDKGLEIARKCGITITGFVRDAGSSINTNMETKTFTEAGMKIYTHAERIENR